MVCGDDGNNASAPRTYCAGTIERNANPKEKDLNQSL